MASEARESFMMKCSGGNLLRLAKMMVIVVLVMKEEDPQDGKREMMFGGGEKGKVDVLSKTQREAGAIM